MAKMSITEVLNKKYLTDSSLAQQLVAGTLTLADRVIKDHIHQVGAYQEIYGPSNEIWYTTTDGEIYDLGGIIERLSRAGATYNGPAVVSNVFDEGKQMWHMTFSSNVTVLGDADTKTMTINGPLFVSNHDLGVVCNVKTIILPESVTRIGVAAFEGCTGLTSIEISNNVTSIGNYAFYKCISLTSVTIPDSVTSIGDWAFNLCNGLDIIICKSTTPPAIGNGAFDDTNDCPIYVPSQSVDAYKESWSEYADGIVGLLNNNQVEYSANEQLTIKDGVDYIDHTFDNGVGLVTFSHDLTTLEVNWFDNTFESVIEGNITSLTLPNGVSSIEMSALSGAGEVYYEGTQKECARINKSSLDGTGVDVYHCFDGKVAEGYQANFVNPWFFLDRAEWLKDLVGVKELRDIMEIISSVKIDEHPMTAGEFITTLVNGTKDIPGLSTYGFTVDTLEVQRVTCPLAKHTESGHFISIVKATDYAQLDLAHTAFVAVNESLDPDYMYILFSDINIPDDPVNVTIGRENEPSEQVSLDPNQTYAEQGYEGYYSQNTYDSSPDVNQNDIDFLVDNNNPSDGDIIYDYCHDTYGPEPAE